MRTQVGGSSADGSRVKPISMVIPAYQAGPNLRRTIVAVQSALGIDDVEIIVVDDGSTDGSAEQLNDLGVVTIRHPQNRGKGAALRDGFRYANGTVVGFIDADLQYDPQSLVPMVALCHAGWDAAIGSRFDVGARTTFGPFRRSASRLMQAAIRVIVDPRLSEAQAGIKVFRRELIDAVLPHVRCEGFAVDAEILAWAQALGFRRVACQPVQFTHSGPTTLTTARTLKALSDLWGIRQRIRHAARTSPSVRAPGWQTLIGSTQARQGRELVGHACRLAVVEPRAAVAVQELVQRSDQKRQVLLAALAIEGHRHSPNGDPVWSHARVLLQGALSAVSNLEQWQLRGDAPGPGNNSVELIA